MNFLAHLLLAGDDPDVQAGQVLADFVTAARIGSFPPAIQEGIRAHQRIDVFADSHPDFGKARRRFPQPYRRYAGVMLDVFFDHFLAASWDRHGDGSTLQDFAAARYRVLLARRHLHPGRFCAVVEAMSRDDWLSGYARVDGVERSLRGLAARCKRDNPLASGLVVLESRYADLQSDFELFFPQLRGFAQDMAAAPQTDGPTMDESVSGGSVALSAEDRHGYT